MKQRKRSRPRTRDTATPEELASFEERAAIMEFCGGLTRTEAERLAELVVWPLEPEQLDFILNAKFEIERRYDARTGNARQNRNT